eukprot:6694434-Alexandrium_andersonii.AAC.1
MPGLISDAATPGLARSSVCSRTRKLPSSRSGNAGRTGPGTVPGTRPWTRPARHAALTHPRTAAGL